MKSSDEIPGQVYNNHSVGRCYDPFLEEIAEVKLFSKAVVKMHLKQIAIAISVFYLGRKVKCGKISYR